MADPRLIFVYNAQSDLLNTMLDYAHKVIKPSTYKCDLCALTHHSFGERILWRDFKKSSNVGMSFYYIRQFEQKFNLSLDYPVILLEKDGALSLLFDRAQITSFRNVDVLVEQLEKFLRSKNL